MEGHKQEDIAIKNGKNLSHSQRNQIYRECERLETARTVAAQLREDHNEPDNASGITAPTSNTQATQSNGANNDRAAGSTRSIGQVSLDGIGQAFNRRRLGAYSSRDQRTSRNIASVSQAHAQQPMTCRSELDNHADTCGVNNNTRFWNTTAQ